MDAPSHRFEGGNSIAEIPVEQFLVPIAFLDASEKARADYLLSAEEIEEYERQAMRSLCLSLPKRQQSPQSAFSLWCRGDKFPEKSQLPK